MVLWWNSPAENSGKVLYLQVLDRFVKIPSDAGCSVAHCVSGSRLEVRSCWCFCRVVKCTLVELIWCLWRDCVSEFSSAWPWTVTLIIFTVKIWKKKIKMIEFHSLYLFIFLRDAFFVLQRWLILLLWYNLASPEWCYILNNALAFLLMLVIWSTGRQEYKLQLRLQFSDYTCRCCCLLGVNKQDVFQSTLW